MSTDEAGAAGHEAEESGGRAPLARRHLLLGGATLVAGCAGAGALRLLGAPAHADRALDVQMLQTAASIENLAVEVYAAALDLPVVGGERAEPLVRDFFSRTRDQHADHANAFNAALTRLGARTQGNADPALRETATRARTAATEPARAVEAALAVETAAAATFQSNAAALSDVDARVVTAAIGGVEAQHVAVLLLVAALLREGAIELLRLSPATVEELPADAGSAGLPAAFTTIERARPPAEGAVR